MPKRIETFLPDDMYHIYNRGVNKQPIFYSQRNYLYFLNLMQGHLIHKARVFAYCLMPNHFHIAVKIVTSDFVQKGLQRLLMSYAKAINIDQNRVGPLFQGRFQCNLIGDENQLLDCIKYIHLNPVKAGLASSPALWQYSSYREYLSGNKNSYLNTNAVMDYFSDITEFREFHELDMIGYKSKHFSEE